jgi:hypothetical protein
MAQVQFIFSVSDAAVPAIDTVSLLKRKLQESTAWTGNIIVTVENAEKLVIYNVFNQNIVQFNFQFDLKSSFSTSNILVTRDNFYFIIQEENIHECDSAGNVVHTYNMILFSRITSSIELHNGQILITSFTRGIATLTLVNRAEKSVTHKEAENTISSTIQLANGQIVLLEAFEHVWVTELNESWVVFLDSELNETRREKMPGKQRLYGYEVSPNVLKLYSDMKIIFNTVTGEKQILDDDGQPMEVDEIYTSFGLSKYQGPYCDVHNGEFKKLQQINIEQIRKDVIIYEYMKQMKVGPNQKQLVEWNFKRQQIEATHYFPHTFWLYKTLL